MARSIHPTEICPAMPDLLYEKRDGVAILTFNRPERRNAFSPQLMVLLCEAWKDFRDDASLRVAILTGAGDKAFISGADISEFDEALPGAGMSRSRDEELVPLEKPLVAMIQGYCIGGGGAVSLGADIRIAADDAQFAIPAARLGVGYPFFGVKALVDLVGPAHAGAFHVHAADRAGHAAGRRRAGYVLLVAPVHDGRRRVAAIF